MKTNSLIQRASGKGRTFSSLFSLLPPVQSTLSHRRLRLERLEDRTVLSSWVFGLPGAPNSTNVPTNVEVDAEGHSLVAGVFSGTADFDAGPGAVNLTSAGGQDIFIAKYAPDKSLLWAQRFGGTSSESSGVTVLDSHGNLFLTGSFLATVSFGDTTLVSSGQGDVFVAKIDGATGAVLWARQMGSDSSEAGNGVALSPGEAELWVTGSFLGPSTFGSFTLPGAGNKFDAFVAKLDSATGSVVWAGQVAGPSMGNAVAVDSIGNAYVTGSSNGDVFLAKLDSAGGSVWTSVMGGGPGSDYGQWITVNDAGHVFLAAMIGGEPIDFEPGPGVVAVTGQSAIAEYTADGELVWAKGSEGYIFELALGAGGDIYICGTFTETADLDPGPGVVSAAGGNEAFVARLTAQGDATWIRRVGGSLVDSTSGITVDSLGNVFAVGSYARGSVPGPSNTADFPTGETLLGPGMFVMKLEQQPSGQLGFATITGKVFNDEIKTAWTTMD